MIRVLFVCIHNSARSQMAEAFLRYLGGAAFYVESAGLEPGKLNPFVVESLLEVGLDIRENVPQSVAAVLEAGKEFDYVITVCDGASADRCPIFPGKGHRLHWDFPDPSKFQGSREEILRQVGEVREIIRKAVLQFVAEFHP